MEPDFWRERWGSDKIAFHEGRPNVLLTRHLERLKLTPEAPIFVPLCGKAMDVAWLAEQGHRVLGVELSEIAVKDFFAERCLPTEIAICDGFSVHQNGRVRLMCGDFFDLRPEHLAGVKAVYDRAAIVALPPTLRSRYVTHLMGCLPAAVPMLTVTFEYAEHEMEGPPFSVSPEEMGSHFDPYYSVEHLESYVHSKIKPELRDRGLTALTEHAFHLNPRS